MEDLNVRVADLGLKKWDSFLIIVKVKKMVALFNVFCGNHNTFIQNSFRNGNIQTFEQ